MVRRHAINQEKAQVGAFSVITNLRMQLFEALVSSLDIVSAAVLGCLAAGCWGLRAESRSRTEQRCPILPRIPASTIVHHHTAAHNRDIGTLPGVLPTLQPSHPLQAPPT